MKKIARSKFARKAQRFFIELQNNHRGSTAPEIAAYIVISLIIAALVLSVLYLLFHDTILPGIQTKFNSILNYTG